MARNTKYSFESTGFEEMGLYIPVKWFNDV